jgi:hypothetical protein
MRGGCSGEKMRSPLLAMLLNAPKADLNNDPICQNKQSNERGLKQMRDKIRTVRGAIAKEAATFVLCHPAIARDDSHAGRGNP